MSLPSILVLICSFNHKPFLKQCIESVLNQTYKGKIQILVSDDGSTDGTIDVLKEFAYDLDIDYFPHEKNLGGYGRENWKFVFQQDYYFTYALPGDGKTGSAPDFVVMIDGDDYLAADRFEKQIKYIQDNDLDGCHSDVTMIYEDGSIKASKWWEQSGQYITNPMTIESQIMNNRVFICTLIAKTELFRESADFDLFTGLGIFLGDYALANRMIQLGGKIGYIDLPLSFYRWREKSESHKDRNLTVNDTGHVQELTRAGKLI